MFVLCVHINRAQEPNDSLKWLKQLEENDALADAARDLLVTVRDPKLEGTQVYLLSCYLWLSLSVFHINLFCLLLWSKRACEKLLSLVPAWILTAIETTKLKVTSCSRHVTLQQKTCGHQSSSVLFTELLAKFAFLGRSSATSSYLISSVTNYLTPAVETLAILL